MDDDKRKNILRGKDIDKIAAACNRYPVMNLHCQLGEKNEEEIDLKVSLNREDELDNDLVISSCYPGEKE